MDISQIVTSLERANPFRKRGSVLGIDIGGSSIKIVELADHRGKVRLLRYGTLSLGPFMKDHVGAVAKLPPDRLVDAIKGSFDAIGVTARQGGIAIPLKLSLVVTIEVPASAEGKLDTVVPLEARRYIPTPPSEVNIAWSIVSSSEAHSLNAKEDQAAKKIKVLVAAIHNSTITSYHEVAGKAGINPVILEIETFSAIRSIFGKMSGTFAMLDIGSDASKVFIIDYGSIAVSHNIHKGAYAMTQTLAQALTLSFEDAEKIKRKEGLTGTVSGTQTGEILLPEVQNIMEEVKQVIEEFEKTNGKKVERVACIGGGALLKGFLPAAQPLVGKEMVLGNPFQDIELPTPVLAPILKEAGPEFAVAVGLGLRALTEL